MCLLGIRFRRTVDHILFMRKDDVQLNPNLSEVEGVKWVSQAELKQMFVDAEAKVSTGCCSVLSQYVCCAGRSRRN